MNLRRRLADTVSGTVAVARSARHPNASPRLPPTWKISDEVRAQVKITWPRQYEWPAAERWVDGLRGSLAAQVELVPGEIEQPYEGTVLLNFEFAGRGHEVAIDYFDRERLLEEVAQRCPLVFKMQYSRNGYGHPHVVPGGYVPVFSHIYRYLPGLRHARENLPPRFDVYGRFSLEYASGTRRAAIAALREQREFAYEGSLATVPYAAYLREAALSRVCIDLPGNGDMCHRLIEYLAVGGCVVRPTPTTRLHVPLADGVNIRFARDAESDLVRACADLLATPEKTVAMGRAARDYFDRYLHVDQLAGYYLDRCLRQLTDVSGSPTPAAGLAGPT